jgi:hypothetical protein
VIGSPYAARVSRSAVLAGLALGVALSTVGATNATAAAPPIVRNVSRRPANQAEAAVAVNPADPFDVVVASNIEFGYGIFVGVSHDGGQTWSRRVLGDRDRFGMACCDPSITWDDRGNLFLSWLAFGGGFNPNAIEVITSTDAGDRWSELARLRPPAPDRARTRAAGPGPRRAVIFAGTVQATGDEDAHGGGFVDQPTITSGHDAVWVIWDHDGWLQAAGAAVHGAGEVGAFQQPEDVPHTHGCTFGDIAIGPRGEVIQVCQRDVVGASPPTSRLRTNIDRDGLGKARGFTSGFAFATTNVSLFEPIRPQRSRTIDAEVGLAWDRSAGPFGGRVYLIFSDERPDGIRDTDTYLMTSDERGGSWTPPSVIEDAPRTQFLPRVALDPTTGSLAVGFHDASLDRGTGTYDTDHVKGDDAMYAITFSTDGGTTWTSPAFVSERPSNAEEAANQVDFGDYTGLAFGAGVAHPAWADNSNSTGDNPDGKVDEFDIYTAAVAAP